MASGGQRPGMLLNILQCMGQPPQQQSGPDVKGAEPVRSPTPGLSFSDLRSAFLLHLFNQHSPGPAQVPQAVQVLGHEAKTLVILDWSLQGTDSACKWAQAGSHEDQEN